MKHKISLFLLVLFVLSFAGCGRQEEDEYIYNYLPTTYPREINFTTIRAQPIENGALLAMSNRDLNCETYREGEGFYNLNCLFNEESKVIIPLCFDATCLHDTTDCFAKSIYGRDYLNNRWLYKDKILHVVNEKDSSSGKNIFSLVVNYYSLDGTLIDKKNCTPELIKFDGTKSEEFYINSAHLQYGHKRYYHAYEYPDYDAPYNERYYENWVICHDLETNTFSSYSLPRSKEGDGFSLVDVNETGLGCKNSEGLGYVLNFETGEITEYDCGEILDRLVSEGQLIRGFEIIDVNPLKDYFVITMGSGRGYVSISTETGLNLPPEEIYSFIGSPWRFEYNGDVYFPGEEYKDNRADYICLNTGDKFTVADKERYYTIYGETENGLILEYVNILPDGSREPTTEKRREGGREVTYFLPKKLAYVTKEDFVDGSVDDPWFYDCETYSFVQQ